MNADMPKVRVMIVEDDPVMAGEIRRMVELFGYEVTSISDTGEKAVARAKTEKPDVVLMDIILKGAMDGIEAAGMIRKNDDIPVVFVTARADAERISRAKATLPYGYVLKPFQAESLKIALEMALHVAAADRERDRARQENRINTLRLEIIHEIAILKAADEKKICDLVLERMLELSDSRIGFLGFLCDDEQTMKIHAWSKSVMAECRIHNQPLEFPIARAGLWGEPVRKRKPLICNDYAQPHPDKKGCPEGHMPINRFLCVPVFDGGRVVAVAAVGNKTDPYTSTDVQQLNLLMQGMWEQIRRKRMEEQIAESELKYRTLFEEAPAGIALADAGTGILIDCNSALAGLVGREKSELIGQPQRILHPPEEIDGEFSKIFAEHRRGEMGLTKESPIITRTGEIKLVAITASQMHLSGRSVLLGIFRDITERKQSEAAIIRHQKELIQINQIGAVVNSTLDLDVILNLALENTVKALQASVGMIFLKDAVSGCLTWGAAIGLSEAFVDDFKQTPLRMGEGLTGTIARTGKPIFIPEDASRDSRVARPVFRKEGLNSFLGVPLFAGETVIGVMNILTRPPAQLTEQDMLVCSAIGSQVGLAIRNAQLFTAREKSEAQYRELVEHANSIILRMDGAGKISFFNEFAQSFFGYSAAEVIGRNVVGTIVPETDSAGRDLGAMVEEIGLHPERYLNNENENMRRDGSRAWIAWTNKPLLDDKGGLKEILCIGNDISELKRVEQSYRMLFREMLSGFALHEIVCDEAGTPVDYRFLAVNPAFERMTGLSAEIVVGRTVRELLPGTEQHWIDIYGRVALTGEPAHFENYAVEIEKYFEVSAFRPAPNQFACGFQDITARKQAEVEHQKLQDQFNQAQKMESIGRLAGGVAHEFNNMLNVILGYSELALDLPDLPEKLRGYLRQIADAGAHSAEVIRHLTGFARKQTIAPRVLDVNGVVAGMVKMMRHLVGEEISLDWRPCEKLWPVKIDPTQLNQILANLCINARDAIAGRGRITITTEMVTMAEADFAGNIGFIPAGQAGFGPGDFVLLSVRDNGCGMDQPTLDKLFEPFFTTKAVGHGTGLGLAMIYGIVSQNNGFIAVDSQPGQGTDFKIYLPRRGDQKDAGIQAHDPAAVLRGRGETVLVVEDKDSLLEMSRDMLESLGYAVLGTTDPEEALRLAEAHVGQIDLLITDVVMPGLNGRELAERLTGLYPEIRCLFMSGHTADIIARYGVLARDEFFIQKPFSFRDLAVKVRRVLEE